jgi:hypothetical protein
VRHAKARDCAAVWSAVIAAALLLSPHGAGVAGPAQQTCDTSLYPLSTPTTRFEDNGDGTVTDTQSKLMWMRCATGQTWARGTCAGSAAQLTWQAAREAAQAVNKEGRFSYGDWRVPQVTELASIAERQCKNPRINLAIFPDTPAEPFWTASTRKGAGSEGFAFVLGFGADGVRYEGKEEKHVVRLVRTAP